MHDVEHGDLQHHQRERSRRRKRRHEPMRCAVGAHGYGPNVNVAGGFEIDVRLVRAVEAEEAAAAAWRARVVAAGLDLFHLA